MMAVRGGDSESRFVRVGEPTQASLNSERWDTVSLSKLGAPESQMTSPIHKRTRDFCTCGHQHAASSERQTAQGLISTIPMFSIQAAPAVIAAGSRKTRIAAAQKHVNDLQQYDRAETGGGRPQVQRIAHRERLSVAPTAAMQHIEECRHPELNPDAVWKRLFSIPFFSRMIA
jgi:hypothetical protein